MKGLLLLAIRAYWKVWPKHWNRGCIFRESCSRHVYRETSESGVRVGLRSLITRSRQCRPGYYVWPVGDALYLKLADSSLLAEGDAAPEILLPIRKSATRIERSLEATFLPAGLETHPA